MTAEREALELIASTDPADAALDPQRAVRVARAALSPTLVQAAGAPQPEIPSDALRELRQRVEGFIPFEQAEYIASLFDAVRNQPVEQPSAQPVAWQALYRRALSEANGLTNYVEDRPELRRAEKRLEAIEAEARTLAACSQPPVTTGADSNFDDVITRYAEACRRHDSPGMRANYIALRDMVLQDRTAPQATGHPSQSTSEFCCEAAWREAKDVAWAGRSNLNCGCDHNESCLECYPTEFREGGKFSKFVPAAVSPPQEPQAPQPLTDEQIAELIVKHDAMGVESCGWPSQKKCTDFARAVEAEVLRTHGISKRGD